ncbi:hypothetical protein IG631_20525 [Alternaria alternata]|nr:hypothetical protein IG631_20525 [Alternaria alternata]
MSHRMVHRPGQHPRSTIDEKGRCFLLQAAPVFAFRGDNVNPRPPQPTSFFNASSLLV